MKIVDIYLPEHYEFYLKNVNKHIGKHDDIESWIKNIRKSTLLIYLKCVGCFNKDCNIYIEERFFILTVIIRFFISELNVDEQIKLNKKHILDLIRRFKDVLTLEYAYRENVIKKRINYTLLKDIKIDLLDLE